MPKLEALYYPNFEPPATWLRSFLLFFDKIRTVVPDDVDFKPSKDISEVVSLISDVFETVSPKQEDIAVEELNFGRMRNAFQIIKGEQPKTKHKKIEIIRDKDGKIRIAGHTFLHNKKVSDNVLRLLREFGLIEDKFKLIFDKLNKSGIKLEPKIENFFIVNEKAADLIVSQVADRISRRYGWNTVTDKRIDFIVNTLNGFDYKSIREPTTALVCSIINCEIPQKVQYMNPKKYKEIRDAYSGIRETFHRVVTGLSNLYRLEAIEDKQILKEQIRGITRKFDSEVEKIKKSNFGRTVKRWMPIGIGGLASLVAAAFGEPTVAITSTSVSVVIQCIQELSNLREPESERCKLQRLIARMQKDILKASEIRRLV